MKELVTYKITIDDDYADGEDLGIEQVALTSKPAIKVQGMWFSEHSPKKEKFSDEVKMRIAGPCLVPMAIYRCEEDGTEYNVEFTEEEIEKIYHKFMRTLENKNKFNLEHNADKTVPAYILEVMLADTDNKIKFISDEYGIKVKKGTMFLVSQITDKDYFEKLVENNQTSFSIEGFLGLKLSEIKNKKEMKEQKLKTLESQMKALSLLFEEIKKEDEVKETELAEEVKEEVIEEVKETELAEEVTEEVVEEVKEEEMAEEVIEEVTEEVKEDVLTMEVVQEMIDSKVEELATIIAELKAQIDEMSSMSKTDTKVNKVEMSAHELKVNAALNVHKAFN
jgi:hypothetical protein